MNPLENTIQFILDDKIVSIDFREERLSPTLTVLNYLRSLPGHKGVKEGCAEGDCGACTVVIAEADKENGIKYKAVNSCLVFLPMIHEKQLITVENLASRNGYDVKLHPVQQALADNNGSQCGYCTPGFVMSMFALYKHNENPSRDTIEDSLTGNLCRCTGYQPMINAFGSKTLKNRDDQFEAMKANTLAKLKKINNGQASLNIITEEQSYFQPQLLEDALALREKHPNAIIINGSTDTALKQTKNFETISMILDLSAIEELKEFKENRNNITLGSGLSLEEIKIRIGDKLPALSRMLEVFASKQIRQLATLGGNIGTASPIGDTIPLMIAYKAQLKLIRTGESRIIDIEDFITGYRQTDLKPDEIIHSVIILKLKQKEEVRFYKVSKRKDLDISTLSAGFKLQLSNHKVENIILAFGGMAEVPKRASQTEAFLLNIEWNRNNIEKAIDILKQEFNPISDARSGREFRITAAGNLLMKFYSEISL